MAALNIYPVNTTPLLTDRLPMIDDPGGTWGVEQVTIENLLLLLGGAVNVTSPSVGMVGDGSTDNSAAFEACTSGAYYVPEGDYVFASQCDYVQDGHVKIIAHPKAKFRVANAAGFGTTSSNGSLISHTTSGGPWDFSLEGLTFDAFLLPNGPGTTPKTDTDGVNTQWPMANLQSGATAGAWESKDCYLNVVNVRGITVYMDDPTNVDHHWVFAGGDSAITFDMEDIRYLTITESRFYGSRDSAVYLSANPNAGTRAYGQAASVNVHANYFEGCLNGVHVKGEIVGGQVHHNTFINCSNAAGSTSGSADVSEAVSIDHNFINGYIEGIRLQGAAAVVHSNVIINGGHFDPDADNDAGLPAWHSMNSSETGITSTFFDNPAAIVMEVGGGSDVCTDNRVWGNYIEGAADTSRREAKTSWSGNDPYVFVFNDAADNLCHDNWLGAGSFRDLCVVYNTCSGNVVSWSTVEMISDFSLAGSGDPAEVAFKGPVLDATLAAQFAGLTSDTAFQTITGFEFTAVEGGVYDIDAGLLYTASAAGDLKVGFSSPGSNVNVGAWFGLGPEQTGSAPITVYDAPGSNKVVFGGDGGTGMGQVRGRMICGSGGAGTVSLQAGQNSSDATATDIEAVSWMKVMRVA